MDGTILGQGIFLASSVGLTNPDPGVAVSGTSNPTIIQVPSAADWVKVSNYTQWGTAGADAGAYFGGSASANIGFEFFWQRGMAAGTGIVSYKVSGAGSNADTLVSGGFTIYDPTGLSAGSGPLLGNPVATTASTNATRPVVSTASTAGLSVGSVVRLSNTAQTDINGIDFVVGAVTTNTSFELLTASNVLATAPGAIGGAGFYRIVNYPSYWYPKRRTVVNITQAVNAQVSTSLEHSLTVGQSIRFNIPSVSGMIQLNPTPTNNYVYATVLTVVDAYNFTIDQNTTSYTAFTWPTIAQQPSSFPTFEPIGENTSVGQYANSNVFPQYQNQNIYMANGGVFADATINTGFYGVILGAGGNGLELGAPIIGPSGSLTWTSGNVATGDTMYWIAGKSDYGGL